MPASLSTHARFARRALVGAGLLGILADPLLRNEPWGLGLLVWMLAFASVLILLTRQAARPLSMESRIWLAVAVLFSAGLSWHDAELLLVFNVLAMLGALTLLALSMSGIPVVSLASARVRDLVQAAFGTGLGVAGGVVPLLLRDAELHSGFNPSRAGRIRRTAKALVITVPILLVFTFLFAQADPVFGSFVTLPVLDYEVALSHVVIAGFFAWVVAGWMRRALVRQPATAGTATIPFPLTLSTTDVTIALGALNVLFATFVLVQLGWLFGGEELVLRTTGLTYAEYARRGFFELMGVAALLLPVLLGAHALIPESDGRTLRIYRALALLLVMLLGAIMFSAGARMWLYVRYYGISADRLYATAFMIWLAIVFEWLALTVLRFRPRTFAAGGVISALLVLGTLNVVNPDALVARSNLARGSSPSGAAGADLEYVASLGGDAVPLVVSALVDPARGTSAATPTRCAAARIILEKWTGERRTRVASQWASWNLARARAVRAVQAHEAALQQLACPKDAHTAVAPLASR
jgi:hypothetical protein